MASIQVNLANFVKYRENLGWSKNELARQAGVSNGIVARIERGNPTSEKILKKIADAMGKKIGDLMIGEREEERPVNIPLYSTWAHAGLVRPDSHIEKWLHIHLEEPEAFALRVTGDSMAPYFLENDIIILSQNREPKSGNFIIIKLINESEPKLKEIFIYEDRIALRSLNPLYPETVLEKRDQKLIERIFVIIKMIRDTVK